MKVWYFVIGSVEAENMDEILKGIKSEKEFREKYTTHKYKAYGVSSDEIEMWNENGKMMVGTDED